MRDNRVLPRKGQHRAVVMAGLAVSAIVVIAAVSLARESAPTKGRIPPSAFKEGTIDKTLVPDFIPALDRSGQEAGYVAKDLAIPDGAPVSEPIPVYAEDLKTLVGHMLPGRGFVPLGVSAESIPNFSATTGGK